MKKIDNKEYKECDVLMLESSNPSLLVTFNMFGKNGLNLSKTILPIEKEEKYQHLYILSDEEIKEGDWYINNGVVFRADDKFDKGNNPNQNKNNKKIIATTDSSLKTSIFSDDSQDLMKAAVYKECELAQIPQEFLEHYTSEFKYGNVINKVLVEVEENVDGLLFSQSLNNYDTIVKYQIKLNQDNELSILIEKDKWLNVKSKGKTLGYWKNNAEEDYREVPISVLRYISILEEFVEELISEQK